MLYAQDWELLGNEMNFINGPFVSNYLKKQRKIPDLEVAELTIGKLSNHRHWDLLRTHQEKLAWASTKAVI